MNNIQCEKTHFLKEEFDGALIDSMKMRTPPSLIYGTKAGHTNDYIPRIQAPWLKYDRQVLRFAGYF